MITNSFNNLLNTPDLDLFTLFERTPDFVCIANNKGYFLKVNPAVSNKLEYTFEELLSKPISSFVHPEDVAITNASRASLIKDSTLLNFQNRYVSKTGKVVWLEWTSIYLMDKELVFGLAKDVTARKIVELEVEKQYHKFKGLATHFKTSIEEDRKYMANELHDEIAQLASAVKVDIDWLSTNIPGLTDAAKERIDHAFALSGLLVNTVRAMSFSISPNMLNDLGLNATLEWYCNEFSKENNIHCPLTTEYDEQGLTSEMKIDFFRICQEALDNIKFHAKATTASVSITEQKNNILLIIKDNGTGFELKQKTGSPGIKEMRERATSINGQLNIKTSTGKGTSITLTVAKTE